MTEGHAVALSDRHVVTVDDDYFSLVERAPEEDFVVREIARAMSGVTPLMVGEIVIAGRGTRARHPEAQKYPLHFRKTYFPGRIRGDPEVEFERHRRASEILGIPGPIGFSRAVFRSCLFPGRPLAQLLPFGTEPEESNLRHAERLGLQAAAGLWLLAVQAFSTLTRLHEAGLAHGDAQPQNFVVCPAPLEVLPIDFDMSVIREEIAEDDWERRCAADLEPLLRTALFLQCALGVQPDRLGNLARSRIDALLARPAPFLGAMEERARLLAPPVPLT
jgi:hypothetical protein